MSPQFLFQAQQEYHLKRVKENTSVYRDNSLCLPSIASRTPKDAYENLRLSGSQSLRIPIYADSQCRFLDAEGCIEFFRAASMYGGAVVPVAPLDYSVCWILKTLGAKQIEVEVSNPFLESGIVRPQLLSLLIEELKIPVVAGGVFSSKEKERLWEMGFHAILNYEQESL